MKTAISLPDDLFASVDALASRFGMSRSGLIAAALGQSYGEIQITITRFSQKFSALVMISIPATSPTISRLDARVRSRIVKPGISGTRQDLGGAALWNLSEMACGAGKQSERADERRDASTGTEHESLKRAGRTQRTG